MPYRRTTYGYLLLEFDIAALTPNQDGGCDAVARRLRSPSVGGVENLMDDLVKQKILALLEAHRIMTIATLRPDGWRRATGVGYVNDGLTLWFLCGLQCQKATQSGAR